MLQLPPRRQKALLALLLLAGLAAGLFLLFPVAFAFLSGAAGSVLKLWWVVLLAALALWLLWSGSRRP